MDSPKNVLIITGDPIGKKLAGPAIRAWNMANELHKCGHKVTLISLTSVEPAENEFSVVQISPGDEGKFLNYEIESDIIIFQGHALLVFESLRKSQKIMIVDIYDPMHLEQLEQAKELSEQQWINQVRESTQVLNDQLVRGDFFICASDRQRLFWLGQLAGLGRVNPKTYESDPDLNGLIDIVPFGLSRTKPEHTENVLRGVISGIDEGDKVLLWSGGLYNWFDPETLIKAVARLSQSRKNIRLFFQGTKHPHPGVPEMEIVAKSRDLAQQLGVLNTSVFFNDSWVDFDERQNYLTEADLGVSTHHSHIETTFSFRTRILDYLWAELPMVVTQGDHFAELVEERKLGISVPAGDEVALAVALEQALFDDAFIQEAKYNLQKVRQEYFWDVVLAPLTNFVGSAKHAGDRGLMLVNGIVQGTLPELKKASKPLSRDLKLAYGHLRTGGISQVMHRIFLRMKRK